VIQTVRLFIREVESGDAASIYGLLSDEEVIRYTMFPRATSDWAEEYVQKTIARSTEQPRRNYSFIVSLRSTGDVIGLSGLVRESEQAELWYCFAKRHWGKGYAIESATALLQFGFIDLKLHRIWATCLPPNDVSQHILEKLNLRREGLMRQNLLIRGEWHDSYLYAILDHEWNT
jgi:RimJ/RimL family protein N-acetyltransferase